ncbi:hypothetical protein, partial [Carboxydocella sp. JDF658]|uniref:hypothetical protein n=1 Tax=Carboxydocella sp. JDF658 TaxID=1926600 RepID=UPI001A9A3784
FVNTCVINKLKNFFVKNWLKQLKKCGFCDILASDLGFSFILEIWARTTLNLYYKGDFYISQLKNA